MSQRLPRRRAICTSCGRMHQTTRTGPGPCRDCRLGTGPGHWVRDGLILRFQPANAA